MEDMWGGDEDGRWRLRSQVVGVQAPRLDDAALIVCSGNIIRAHFPASVSLPANVVHPNSKC